MARSDLEHYHDKGQKDAADDKGFNEPNPTYVVNNDRDTEQNKAYRDGYHNAEDQKKK
ncbi:MAG: hypothetical protein HYZ50_24000 [Deltaproteobacteria bacterium]|nr:hypothetical protein [Deltaproteobacteria bacterium]